MKIRKSNLTPIISRLASKLVKIASMDVYVSDFDYPRKLDTLSDLSWSALGKLEKIFSKMSEDEKKTLQQSRISEMVTPDGDGYDQSQGIINFYTSGLSPQREQEFLQSIIQSLKEDGAEKIGVPKKEKSNMYKSEVIRIPVGNIVKKEQIRPPELNMANANAVHIFRDVLKYQPHDEYASGFSDIDANELVQRINYHLGEQKLPERPSNMNQKLVPWQEGIDEEYQKIDTIMGPMKEFDPTQDEHVGLTMHNVGLEDEQIRVRLERIKAIAQWAVKHGYKKLHVV